MFDGLIQLDKTIFLLINGLPHNSISIFLSIVSLYWYWAVILFLFIKNAQTRKLSIANILLLLILISINSLIFKNLVARPRPEAIFAIDWEDLPFLPYSNYSFPSGHGVLAMGTAIFLGLRYPKYLFSLLVITVLSSLARIYVGAHYPSDIVASWIEGTIITLIFSKLWLRFLNRQ